MSENEDAPRIRQGERKRYLKEHPELVPAGKLRRKGLRAPAAALASAVKEPVPRVEGPLPKTIVLDTETTGLRGWSDHLLTVGIVDGEGGGGGQLQGLPAA